jgi:hypothetical protein
VHDEIVAEVPDGFGSTEEFLKIITALPDWAKGLPVAAKVREGERFCKISKPEPKAEEPVDPVGDGGDSREDDPGYSEDAGEPDEEDEPGPTYAPGHDNRNRDGYPKSEDQGRSSWGPSYISQAPRP